MSLLFINVITFLGLFCDEPNTNVGDQKFIPEFVRGRLHWVDRAYTINDDSFINDSERESLLIKLFAENGHELEFK